MYPFLKSIRIEGYRPFGDFHAELGPLEVLVGANGSGKSSLFEFLRFIRDGVNRDIPPEIVAGAVGQQIFHAPGPERFRWSLTFAFDHIHSAVYEGELAGPLGKVRIHYENVDVFLPDQRRTLEVKDGRGTVWSDHGERDVVRQSIGVSPRRLALGMIANPDLVSLSVLRSYVSGWRFYKTDDLALEALRKPVIIEQEPLLQENGANLSAVLHYLLTEHKPAFDNIQQILRLAIPGFRELTMKAWGGRGQIIAFWKEDGVKNLLSLADLSDGILRLLFWLTVCLQPSRPGLICIDEPDQGVHPRTIPLLAGLFQKASDRTQVLLATHASYFLTQFELPQIAVMRKEDGEAKFLKPTDSKVLKEILEDFGPKEIELLHRTDELEQFA